VNESRNASALIVDLAVIAVLLAAAAYAFDPLYASGAWILAAGGALVLGVALGALAGLRRWPFSLTVLATVAAYLLFGGALVLRSTTLSGVVPSLDTLIRLAQGATSAWKDLLTVHVPTEGLEVVVLVPFISVLVCSVLGAALAVRPRREGWAMLGPGVLLVVAIAFGTYRGAAPLAQAVVLVLLSVAWLSWRRAQARAAGLTDADGGGRSGTTRRLVAAAAVLVVGVVGGGAWAWWRGEPEERHVLRDQVVPPLELHDYASPLQSFRRYVRDFEDTTLFTVENLPPGARVQLAVLDSYDGVVYAVSGDGTDTAGSFERVGSTLVGDGEGEPATVEVTIGALRGVWLPTVGRVESGAFSGPNGDLLADALHYNRVTGTAVVTTGLREGDAYSLQVRIPPEPDPDALADAPYSSMPVARVDRIPDGLRELASEVAGDDRRVHAEVASMVKFLSGSGYFSHGLAGQAPSRSGHGVERIGALIAADQMIGDDEQYAVAFALMAHELGIPARVVMGFYPEDGSGGTFAVTGKDVHVWAEVAYGDVGWVAVDPAPAEDKAPVDEEQSPQREPKPQVLQPPPPPQEPARVPPAAPTDDEAVDRSQLDLEQVLRVLVYVASGAGLLLVLTGPFLAILVAKARRRRRRRRSRDLTVRVAEGWNEVVDVAVDYGLDIPDGRTRVEKAHIVDSQLGAHGSVALAAQADACVWAPGEPAEEEVEEFWEELEAHLAAIHRARSRRERLLARLSPRSLGDNRHRMRGRRRVVTSDARPAPAAPVVFTVPASSAVATSVPPAQVLSAPVVSAPAADAPATPMPEAPVAPAQPTAHEPLSPASGLAVGSQAAGETDSVPGASATAAHVSDRTAAIIAEEPAHAPYAPIEDLEDEALLATRLALPRIVQISLMWDDGTVTTVTSSAVIGRNPAATQGEAEVAIVDMTRSLSKTHARFTITDSGPVVEDLNSTNGVAITRAGQTFDIPPVTPVALAPGDVLVFGSRHASVVVTR